MNNLTEEQISIIVNHMIKGGIDMAVTFGADKRNIKTCLEDADQSLSPMFDAVREN